VKPILATLSRGASAFNFMFDGSQGSTASTGISRYAMRVPHERTPRLSRVAEIGNQ